MHKTDVRSEFDTRAVLQLRMRGQREGLDGPRDSEDLYPGTESRCRGESSVTGNQRGADFFGEHNVSCIVSANGMTVLPDTRQEKEVRVSRDSQVEQVFDRMVGTAR